MTHRARYLSLVAGGEPPSLSFLPITMMFAADFARRPYREYATDYHVLVDGQCAVAEEFDTSIVSVISDPCVEAADLGADCLFPDDAPPAVREETALLGDRASLGELSTVDPTDGRRMANRLQAVESLKAAAGADRIVEGWVEGPCAEAADLRGINNLMLDFYDDPIFVGELMDFVLEQAILFAEAQIAAGADIIGIGDAASSLIGGNLYAEFVECRTRQLVDRIHAAGGLARLHICGRITPLLESLATVGADQVDVDSMNPMAEARRHLDGVLCGNLDPVRVVRDGSPGAIALSLSECFEAAGPKYAVGAGCEIPRGTPCENLRAMRSFADR